MYALFKCLDPLSCAGNAYALRRSNFGVVTCLIPSYKQSDQKENPKTDHYASHLVSSQAALPCLPD